MADVKQMKKIVPLITCEIPFCQYVCKFVFCVDIIDLKLGVQIDSVKQPIKSNSEGSGYMSHCWTSAFNDYFRSRLRYPQRCTAPHQIETTSRSTGRSQHRSNQNCRAGLEPWFCFGRACLMWCEATSFPVLDLWCCWVGLVKNETLLKQIPKIKNWDSIHA